MKLRNLIFSESQPEFLSQEQKDDMDLARSDKVMEIEQAMAKKIAQACVRVGIDLDGESGVYVDWQEENHQIEITIQTESSVRMESLIGLSKMNLINSKTEIGSGGQAGAVELITVIPDTNSPFSKIGI